MSELTRRTLNRITDSGFTRAKKLADLAIKTSFVNGKATERGYEQAIQILTPYTVSDGNEGIDAKRLVAGYNNLFTKLQEKKRNVTRSAGEVEMDERNAYYAASTGAKANFIASNDILGLVSFQRETLNENLFKIQESITTLEEEGGDVSTLYNKLNDAYRRYKDIERLEDDLQNGDVSSLGEYGVFIDSDKNGIDGVFVSKINDLPPGIEKGRYAPLEERMSVSGVEGGMLPVYGEFFVDSSDRNSKKVVIGNREWKLPDKVDGNLRYNNKSDPTYISNSKKGSFSVADFTVKNNPISSKEKYFTGIVGFDEDGVAKKQLFMSSPDGKKLYSIDDDTRKKLEQDPLESEPIKRAFKRNELDSRFIREAVIPNAEPYKIESFSPQVQSSNIDPSGTALQPTVSPASFFGNREAPPAETPMSTNTPTPPREPAVSQSTPDLVEQGKSFFRKVGGFFSQRAT